MTAPHSIVFVSRGRGRGHAIPDIAIAEELYPLVPDVRINFVSYATGADTYRKHGLTVLDLQMPEDPPFLEIVVRLTRMLFKVRAETVLVISHEEFAALPAAAACEIPAVFLTDFFLDPNHMAMETLRYASEILFLGKRGVFTEPPNLSGKIQYVGRAIRPFRGSLSDRNTVRAELSIPNEATVVLVQPGSWTESRMPLYDLVFSAWSLLTCAPKYLVWVAGSDFERLSERGCQYENVRIIREHWRMETLLLSSDVLISKTNRLTVYEAAFFGLPSVSLSSHLNWPDEVAIAEVESNRMLDLGDTTPQQLADALTERLKARYSPAVEVSDGVKGAAKRLATYIVNGGT